MAAGPSERPPNYTEPSCSLPNSDLEDDVFEEPVFRVPSLEKASVVESESLVAISEPQIVRDEEVAAVFAALEVEQVAAFKTIQIVSLLHWLLHCVLLYIGEYTGQIL